jgi:hypothetical protein
MATSRGNQLAQEIRQKVAALKEVCQGVDENLASRAPTDRWSILTHLSVFSSALIYRGDVIRCALGSTC